jgi:hypothetical protein
VELFRITETVSYIGTVLMLLMLMIFWLARSPMRVSAGRLAATLAIIAAITISCGTQTTTAIAEDRYDRTKGPATFEPAVNNKHNAELLREGTLIPPTAGRIVMLGRRWAFIPASQELGTDDDLVKFGKDQVLSSMVSFTRKQYPSRLGTASTSVSTSAYSKTGATLVRTESSKGNTFETVLPQVLVVENLMLQRIADAIRTDGSDDRWTVSGEVTEYFNENQLLIRTAQRSGSK